MEFSTYLLNHSYGMFTIVVCMNFQKKTILATRLFSFQFEKVLNNKSYLLQMADFTTMKVSKSQEAVAAQGCS